MVIFARPIIVCSKEPLGGTKEINAQFCLHGGFEMMLYGLRRHQSVLGLEKGYPCGGSTITTPSSGNMGLQKRSCSLLVVQMCYARWQVTRGGAPRTEWLCGQKNHMDY
jgi:hypothetical protein